MNLNLLRAFFMALCLALILPDARAAEVSRWSVYEIPLQATGKYQSPFLETGVSATFKGPDGVTRKVPGFWDGGNAFRIRFTPTAEGQWTYETQSQDPGLGGKSGALTCTAPASGSHGFVRRDPQRPYHFIRDDDSRFFLFGQTYYRLMDRNEQDWKASIDGTSRRGMNKIRFNVPPGDVKTLPESVDPAYWRKLDAVVRHMNDKGVLADFLIFGMGTFSSAEEQDRRYLRYVVARYAAFPNVVWTLVNEWNYRPKPRQYWNAMGAIVKAEDPWSAEGQALRMLSIHQQTRINWQFFDQSWPAHVIIQYGVRNKDQHQADEWKNTGRTKYRDGDEWGNAGILFNMGHNMPVVNDEYGYIGEPKDESERPVRELTREKHRNIMWGIYAAGGYGSAGDKRKYEDGKPYIEPTVWRDPVEYQDIQRLVEFFTAKGLEFWKMAAHNELVKSGRRVYALAEPGRQYVIYAAAGGRFAIELAPGSYEARRYDPRTGEDEGLGNVAGGAAREFSLPDAQDWVVYLRAGL